MILKKDISTPSTPNVISLNIIRNKRGGIRLLNITEYHFVVKKYQKALSQPQLKKLFHTESLQPSSMYYPLFPIHKICRLTCNIS